MKHHEYFFMLLTVAVVLLVAALLSPALLGMKGTSGFTASVTEMFVRP